MAWIAVAVGGSALVGAGVGLYASGQQSNAMESAANTQANSANYAADLQYKMWQEQQKAQKPWMQAGQGALNQLTSGLDPGGKFASYPGYQWRLQQGVNALDASSAASGSFGSGNLGVALQNYGQNLGSQEYQAAYNRAMSEYNTGYSQNNDLYNRLAGLSGTGQNTATNLGNMGMNTATNMGNMYTGGANALAAGQIGSSQVQGAGITGAYNTLSNAGGNYMNYLQNQQFLQQMQPGSLTQPANFSPWGNMGGINAGYYNDLSAAGSNYAWN
jgi:hypothetical protein